MKYCVLDENTTNKLFNLEPNINPNCSENCFNKNVKFDVQSSKCTQSCNQNYYELNSECYMNNPDNSLSFYLDADGIYRLCYNKCQNCSKSRNKTINNCDICKDGYIFLNDSLAYHNNCYIQCKYYYYFGEDNIYFCTKSDECPLSHNKIIKGKNKCINDCQKDDEYIYEYNNTCLKKCPENTKMYYEEKKCLESLIQVNLNLKEYVIIIYQMMHITSYKMKKYLLIIIQILNIY